MITHKHLGVLAVLLFLVAFFLVGDQVNTGSAWDSPGALMLAGLAAFAAAFHRRG